MYSFGKHSKARLATCHPDLQKLFNEVIKEVDCSILCGYRGKKEQNEAFAGGFSKLQYPKSKHNRKPSLAVDAMPYPIDWHDLPRIIAFVEVVKKKANELGIKIRCGADFPTFKDYPHFELVVVKED